MSKVWLSRCCAAFGAALAADQPRPAYPGREVDLAGRWARTRSGPRQKLPAHHESDFMIDSGSDPSQQGIGLAESRLSALG